jgi:hypothetical protein
MHLSGFRPAETRSDDQTLSLSAGINAAFEKVNIADWLFNLPGAGIATLARNEYIASHL